MQDRDFEFAAAQHLAHIRAERLTLFTDVGYFARWRELAANQNHATAWHQVECEFFEAYRCRRFLTYAAFRRALSREGARRAEGETAQYVRVYTNVT